VRPPLLAPLFAELSTLKGVGPTLVKYLTKLVGGPKVFHLLRHLPNGFLYRRGIDSLTQANIGELITCRAKVLEHHKGHRQSPYRVVCDVNGDLLWLVFFNPRADYLQKQLPVGAEIVVSGKYEFYQSRPQITHPDHIGPQFTYNDWVGFEPTYPLTQALTQKYVRKLVKGAVTRVPELPEWLSERTLKWHHWQSWHESLAHAHSPKNEQELLPTAPARERLAYDELLADQLALRLVRRAYKTQSGRSLEATNRLIDAALKLFPFPLTADQTQAFNEIKSDLALPMRMNRLLQGDVGSGKTVVAFLTMLVAIEHGKQAAIMAPTEILARQHYNTLQPWAKALGVNLNLLTGKDKASHRNIVYKGCESGDIQIVIGTHALIQEDLHFKDLAVAVIDEQHRFGVDQRLKLLEKGKAVDLLLMTATPIPRTLMMASYGDVDCSYLRQKPAGRQEILTRLVSLSRFNEVVDAIKRATQHGEKIYWVCPLVEESEALDLAAAEKRFEDLQLHLPGQVGLIHGRLKAAEKSKVMEQFIAGEIKVLIATTVIEVGVDVSDATIMVIEHAERFGLAQLHQLRGRIGRGEKQATCLLLYERTMLSDTANSRLQVMRDSNDGFVIAEEDWKLRGGGDVLGIRQSGMPGYIFADLLMHQYLLKEAVHEADEFLASDPHFQSPRGQALRLLLYLFEKEEMIKYLRV
jgi:ATP-dependent DNA helicase RecG